MEEEEEEEEEEADSAQGSADTPFPFTDRGPCNLRFGGEAGSPTP